MDEDHYLRNNPGYPFDLDRLFGPPSSPPLALPEISDQTYTTSTEVSFTLPEATGGEGTKTYSVSELPNGLTFTASTREITGMPTTAGTATVTYTVTDSSGSQTQTFAIAVNEALAAGFCDRNPAIRDAVVRAVSGKDNCNEITPSDLAGITRLDVSGLEITSVTVDDFDGLTSLTDLDLSGNLLVSIPVDAFSDLTNLRVLNLDGNQLTSLVSGWFTGLRNLETLRVARNKIRNLPGNFMNNLRNLKNFFARDNEIDELVEGVFGPQQRLPEGQEFQVDLRGNPLTKIRNPQGTLCAVEILKTDNDVNRYIKELINELLEIRHICDLTNWIGGGVRNLLSSTSRGASPVVASLTGLPEDRTVSVTSYNPANTEERPSAYTVPSAAGVTFMSVADIEISGGTLSNPFELCISRPTGPGTPVIYYGGEDGSSWTRRETSVKDGQVCTMTQTASFWAVGLTNARPAVLEIDAMEITTGQPASLDLLPYFNDTDGDALTFSAQSGNEDVASASVSGSRLTVTPVSRGTAEITVRASDGTLAAAQTFTVTVRHLETLDETLLSEIARSMADSTISAIAGRISQSGGSRRNFSFGGQSTMAGIVSSHGEAILNGGIDRSMLGNSDFVIPTGFSSVVLWGKGDYRNLSGRASSANWNGDLFGLHFGADARPHKNLLTGLSASWNNIDLSAGGLGGYEAELVSVNPYLGLSARRIDLWTTAGYGWGGITRRLEGETAESDISTTTGGWGITGLLWNSGTTSLSLKSDLLVTSLKVKGGSDVAKMSASASRLRTRAELSRRFSLIGGTFEPSAEAGWRVDGGDGEKGGGIELGLSLRYGSSGGRLSVETKSRFLAAHTGSAKEWGLSGGVDLRAGANGKGLSASLSPTYGDTGSGIRKLWNEGLRNAGEDVSKPDYRPAMDARVGYGLPSSLGGGSLLTPYTETTFGRTNSYRLGMDWELGSNFALNLTGERHEPSGAAAEHSVLLKGALRF